VGKRIFLAPLGCAKNQVDGELMLGRALAEGHTLVDDAGEADVLVVNTCAFIEQAREESIDTILGLARIKEGADGRRLVVTGCMAERYGGELHAEMPEIDALVGTGALDRFTEALDARGGALFKGSKHYLPSASMQRLIAGNDGSAYLKVSEGCDHECSFCVIPSFRGRHESRTPDDVVAEAETLAASGIVELNLIAQDLSAYGRDLDLTEGLAALLSRLGRVPHLERVRCFYLYPNTLTDAALDAIATVDNVCAYVDLPLQHADPDVLRRMRRARDTDQLRRIVDRARERIENAVLRTAFIVGFPGETEDAFDRLCRFVEEMRFDHVAVFGYSREEGSAAAELDGVVPPAVIERRRDTLLALQETIAEERLAERVGRVERVLVCGLGDDGCWYGRTDGQAPEIDGVTFVDGDLAAWRGRLISARVTACDAYDLYAEPVDLPAHADSTATRGRHGRLGAPPDTLPRARRHGTGGR
jgi:ribosomal protein S12 methylthiotransferase